VEAGFFAIPAAGSACSKPVGSSVFRGRGGRASVPEGRVLEAHLALVETLERDGWEPVRRGAHWYETRFRRLRTSESVEDAAVDPSPERSSAAPARAPLWPAYEGVPAGVESSAETGTGRGLARRLGLTPQAARTHT